VVPAPDGGALYFVADEQGQRPLFRLALAGLALTRLTARGSFATPVPAPDGRSLYAVGARFDRPPDVVRLAATAADQASEPLVAIAAPALAGLELRPPVSLRGPGAGGREVHSFLLLPEGPPPASGFPLLLWIHGGPLGAWSDGWHWRWNPRLFTARGYAVLLVNPRISTGYGQAFIEEGFARWGDEPYRDLMAALDQAVARPDIDGQRLAAMGGSFGGYMANWIAGREKRFRAIVSHAGLWHLVGFHGTTDFGPEWEREFGGDPYRHPEVYERWSPHRAVEDIRTPMLIVHGEKDYRVPVSEAFQLFTALDRLGAKPRLLYFPDENHWILRPPNIRQWHETIWAFLAEHLG
jgi:dipeptidyl aminopeptidase/acylaminoacyl peptidase